MRAILLKNTSLHHAARSGLQTCSELHQLQVWVFVYVSHLAVVAPQHRLVLIVGQLAHAVQLAGFLHTAIHIAGGCRVKTSYRFIKVALDTRACISKSQTDCRIALDLHPVTKHVDGGRVQG